MTAWMPWRVSKKDFKIIMRKRSIIGYTVGVPIVMGVAFSLVVQSDVVSAGATEASLGLNILTYIFVILAAVLPTSTAAYSIVGEKVDKSLEPLLATPTTDGDLLLGKAIASFVPAVLAIWVGAAIFLVSTDYLTYGVFGGLYFPSLFPAVVLFLEVPLAAALGIEMAVILSARVSDVRGANQLAGLMYIPFMATFIAGADGLFPFDVETLLVICGILVLANVGLFYLSKATFNREEILTKWK
jgi:ABC-2 type transport system permease protein